jgi:hypothetical protein
MNDAPRRFTGIHLTPDDYFDDFFPRFWSIDTGDFWKLERIQTFQEEGSASWDASMRGDWAEALRLIEERRHSLSDYYRKVAASGFTTYRVRVVDEEISAYLRWELFSLRQRAELGERIRIVDAADLARHEIRGRLPEIVTVGGNCAYEVRYDDDGAITGAVRSDNPRDVRDWRDFIRGLYQRGQDIGAFFQRRADALREPVRH